MLRLGSVAFGFRCCAENCSATDHSEVISTELSSCLISFETEFKHDLSVEFSFLLTKIWFVLGLD